MSDEETKVEAAEPAQEPVQSPEPEAPAAAETAAPEEAAPAQPEEVVPAAPEEPAYKAKLANLDELKTGMTVRVHEKIKDVNPKGEERERIQVFEGMILGLRGSGNSRTMTVRKVSDGIGVEKIYPINSPVIAKLELVKTAKVRKAKLSYLQNLKRRFKRKLKETYVQN